MQKRIKSLAGHLLKFLFSFGLIVWLVQSGRLEFGPLKQLLEPALLLTCLLTVGITITLATQRWRYFLDSQSLGISFGNAIRLNLIGIFFNYAVPGGVGGDLVKGYYITKSSPHAKMSAALTVFMDRLIGLFSMVTLSLSIMIWKWDLISQQIELLLIFKVLIVLALGFCVFWALMFSRRLYNLKIFNRIIPKLPKGDLLLKAYETLMHYRHFKETFIITFFVSLVTQGIAILFFIIVGNGLGYDQVPASVYFFVVPVAFMIQSLPLSFGGVGIGQTASYFLFNLSIPGSGPVGAATTTAYQIVTFAYGLIGAYFYMGIAKKIKNSTVQVAASEVAQ
jgi:uncharacterized protein (TIRG00374 family)